MASTSWLSRGQDREGRGSFSSPSPTTVNVHFDPYVYTTAHLPSCIDKFRNACCRSFSIKIATQLASYFLHFFWSQHAAVCNQSKTKLPSHHLRTVRKNRTALFPKKPSWFFPNGFYGILTHFIPVLAMNKPRNTIKFHIVNHA